MAERVVAIIQARAGSSRLPGKIFKPIVGKPLLSHMIERVLRSKKLDALVLATSDSPADDATAALGGSYGITVFRGSERDVLDRFYKAALEARADVVVRLTGDCVLHDPHVIDEVIGRFFEKDVDYTSTPANYPQGLDAEVFLFAALEVSAAHARLPSEREHATQYIQNHPELFTRDKSWTSGVGDFHTMHWSVDTPADFAFAAKIFEKLYPHNPSFSKDDVLALLAEEPELLEINRGGTGYEGLAKSLEEDRKFLLSLAMKPDAIIVFSAGIMPLPGGGWRTTTYEESDAFGTLGGHDRVEAAALLAKQYPNAYVVTTSHTLGRVTPSIAEVCAAELRSLGVKQERIIEEESSNTTQTALRAALELAERRGWTHLMLVSSGFHIPRIKAFFESTKSSVHAEFVASEPVLMAADPSFAPRFAAMQKTPPYRLRLESERRGIEALKRGAYVSAPPQDKKER